MLDSGSTRCLLQESSLKGNHQYVKNNLKVKAVTGDPIKIEGQLDIHLKLGNEDIGSQRFLIQKDDFPSDFQGILGTDWLTNNGAIIDYKVGAVRINNQKTWIPFWDYTPTESYGINAVIDNTIEPEPMEEYEVVARVKINATKPGKIPALSTGNLEVKWRKNNIPENNEEVIIYVEPNRRIKSDLEGLTIGRALLNGRHGRSYVPYVNITDQEYYVDKGDVLAIGTILIKRKLPDESEESEKRRKDPKESLNLNEKRNSDYKLKREESLNQYTKRDLDYKQTLRTRNEETKFSTSKPDVSRKTGANASKDQKNQQSKKVYHKTTKGQVEKENDQGKKQEKGRESIFIGALNIMDGKEFDKAEDITKLIEAAIKKSECPEKHQMKLKRLLSTFQDVLAKKGDSVGLCEFYQPSINLDTEEPIYVPQYPIPHAMRKEVTSSINQFLEEGIIQYSRSPYNAPTLMVKKKDSGYRMVVDYRKLNMHIITDPFPLPRIAQILEDLGGCKYFTTLDLLNGFYNLEIKPSDRYKTAFSTHDGHYEFIRLPMGLKNSPSIFQRMMNAVLQGSLGKYAYIYIDDIVIYSKTAKDHLKHIEKILLQLREANLRIKFSKCQFFQTSVEYLGYIIGRDGMRVNPKKLKSISHFPIPKDVKGVQAFLGLVGYFRLFVENFASIARPLYDLLKKSTEFKWTIRHTTAFNKLKDALMNAPVLAFPDFDKEFILTTDASSIALGAILTQETPKGEVLISCHSRALKKAEINYSNTDRELSAVMYGVKQNRSYLWGHPFVIRTDHMAIPYLQRNMTDNYRAIRWHTELGEYTYRVEHRKGKSIGHADALSRYPHNEELTCYLSPSMQSTDFVPIWDLKYWKKMLDLEKEKPDCQQNQDYKEIGGLIYFIKDNKQILWVPRKLRFEVIQAFHDPPSMGHQGVDKTYNAMKELVTWKNMQKDVRSYIQSCDVCQKYKAFKHMTPSQRVPIPLAPFEEISMDIVGPVPNSRAGNRYVLVIQDRLSRWLVFTPIPDQSAETTIRAFLTKWICVYGVPKKVITDRGTNFVSELFAELHKFLGIRPSNTCAYRPQGNGQNERSHQTLHKYLAMYLEPSTRSTWDTMLSVASWVHNSTPHRSLNISPFEVITGLKPRQAQAWLPQQGETAQEMFQQYMDYYGVNKKKLAEIREMAREMIGKAQTDYLERLNRNSKELIYKVGDLVLIRVQDRSTYISRKWSAKYKGPYRVTAIIGPTVVKIKDPETNKEDLIHIVYLRPYREKSPPPSSLEEEPRSYQSVEIGLGQKYTIRDVPESEPESDVESLPDLTEVTPFGATGQDILAETEKDHYDVDIGILPPEDSWQESPTSTAKSTPTKYHEIPSSDESMSPSFLENSGAMATASSGTVSSESSPEDPRKQDRKKTWREKIAENTKSLLNMWQTGAPSDSEEEPKRPLTRSQTSDLFRWEPKRSSGAKPKKRVQFDVKTRSQSESTPSSSKQTGGEMRAAHTPDLESKESEDQGRRSKRLASKPKPDYHEPRLESQREIRTRHLKSKQPTDK